MSKFELALEMMKEGRKVWRESIGNHIHYTLEKDLRGHYLLASRTLDDPRPWLESSIPLDDIMSNDWHVVLTEKEETEYAAIMATREKA